MQEGGLGKRKTNAHNLHTSQTHSEGNTLLWGSVGRHRPLPHDMVPLVDLAHHTHWGLLPLVVLSTTTRRHVILLRGRLLVHHGACGAPRVNSQTVLGRKAAYGLSSAGE